MSEGEARLHTAFGGQALARLRARLRERIERGRPLSSGLTLRDPSDAERRAVEGLLGRARGRGVHLTIRPLELQTRLVGAGLAGSLREALERVDGPLVDRAQAQAVHQRAWAQADAVVEALGEGRAPALDAWRELRREGQIRRSAGADPEVARQLALGYAAGVRALESATRADDAGSGGASSPAWLSLAELATRVTGDAHGLDAGRPLTSLLLRYVAHLAGETGAASSQDSRTLWSAAGIEVDPLSSHVLLLNLRLDGDGPVAVTLRAHAEVGEPCRLTLRALRHHLVVVGAAADVFVCENPMVVLAAARELGARGRALLCLEGHPSAAATTLMNALVQAGTRLHYHGDFDWPGMRIASGVSRHRGAEPWRMSAADYERGAGSLALAGVPTATPWDPALADAMLARGVAVHEEAVLDDLLGDLRAR